MFGMINLYKKRQIREDIYVNKFCISMRVLSGDDKWSTSACVRVCATCMSEERIVDRNGVSEWMKIYFCLADILYLALGPCEIWVEPVP